MHFLYTLHEVMEGGGASMLILTPKKHSVRKHLDSRIQNRNLRKPEELMNWTSPMWLRKLERDRFVRILNSRTEIKTRSHVKDLVASQKSLKVCYTEKILSRFFFKISVLSNKQTDTIRPLWQNSNHINLPLTRTVLSPARQGYELMWVLYYRQIQFEEGQSMRVNFSTAKKE